MVDAWLVEKRMVDFFLFAIINFFSLSITVPEFEAKRVQLGCFHRGRPLCTQILPGQGRPHEPFLASEN